MTGRSARGRGSIALRDVTHSSRAIGRRNLGRGPVRGPGHQIIPARRVPSVRCSVPSAQLAPALRGSILLIIRRPWVRVPPAPPGAFMLHPALTVDRFADRCRRYRVWCRPAKHPSRSHRATAEGLWRAKVYAGKDPLTGREIRFRKTCKSELAAQKELGKPPHISRPDRRTASGPTPIPQVAEVRQPRFIRFVQICVRDRPWFLLPRLWCRPWRRRRGFRRPGPR